MSDFNNINCGVSQGSTLGPLLFIINGNNVIYNVKGTVLSLYADDTVCCVKGKDLPDLNNVMNIAARHFKDWCDLNVWSFGNGWPLERLPSHAQQLDCHLYPPTNCRIIEHHNIFTRITVGVYMRYNIAQSK